MLYHYTLLKDQNKINNVKVGTIPCIVLLILSYFSNGILHIITFEKTLPACNQPKLSKNVTWLIVLVSWERILPLLIFDIPWPTQQIASDEHHSVNRQSNGIVIKHMQICDWNFRWIFTHAGSNPAVLTVAVLCHVYRGIQGKKCGTIIVKAEELNNCRVRMDVHSVLLFLSCIISHTCFLLSWSVFTYMERSSNGSRGKGPFDLCWIFHWTLEHNKIPAKVLICFKTAVKKLLIQLFQFEHKNVRLVE